MPINLERLLNRPVVQLLLAGTPVGQGLLAARRQKQDEEYRAQIMKREQQEWDQGQQQLGAARQAFMPGAPHPDQIPVTPQVGAPGYDQARQQLDQTQVGTASPVDFLKGPQSAMAQGLAKAGMFTQAANVVEQNAPKQQLRTFGPQDDPFGLGGAGQIDPSSNQVSNYQRPLTANAGNEGDLRTVPFGDESITYKRVGSGWEVFARAPRKVDDDSPSSYENLDTIVDQDGNELGLGIFDRREGKTYFYDQNNKLALAPPGSRRITPSMGGAPTRAQYDKYVTEYQTEVAGLKALDNYLGTQKDRSVGWKLLADQVSGNVKTFFNNPLNAKELAAQVANGQLQALVPLFRTNIAGGGAPSDADMRRIMQAIGGDVNQLQNPEVVRRLIEDLYNAKKDRIGTLYNRANRWAPLLDEQPPDAYTPSNVGASPNSAAPQPSQSTQAPPAAIQELRQNPALAPQFDEVFGPGAAQRILGGG